MSSLLTQVYQHNVFPKDSKFHSFRSVLLSMGEKMSRSVQIPSFFSISKGYLGECTLTNCIMYVHLSVQYWDMYAYFTRFVSGAACEAATTSCGTSRRTCATRATSSVCGQKDSSKCTEANAPKQMHSLYN